MTTRRMSATQTTAARALMIFLTVLCAVPAESCDCWIAMRDATTDGSVILAKNSDRPSAESQPLVCFPRRHHQQGETVKCTYIEIPQPPVTYEHIGSKIWWTFGYEHGMNEHGVAIGNEAVWSKEPLEGKDWDRHRKGSRFRQGSEGPEVVAGRWGQGTAQLGAVFLNAE